MKIVTVRCRKCGKLVSIAYDDTVYDFIGKMLRNNSLYTLTNKDHKHCMWPINDDEKICTDFVAFSDKPIDGVIVDHCIVGEDANCKRTIISVDRDTFGMAIEAANKLEENNSEEI